MTTATVSTEAHRVPTIAELTGNRPDRGRWMVTLTLLAILIVGAALRLPGLFSFPLEQDELYTVMEATDLFDTQLLPGIDARPLYYLLQHALFEVIPQTPFGLRLPPFVFGMIGIWVSWLIGARMIGTSAGLASAMLVAISPWHLYISGMARYWALVYLLAATFFYFLVRSYTHERRRDLVCAFLALACGTLTHPSFVFAAAGASLGVSLISADGRFRWRWPSSRIWLYLWLPFAALLCVEYLVLSSGNPNAIRNWNGRGLSATLRLVPAIAEWAGPAIVAAGGIGALLLLGARAPATARRWGAVALLGLVSPLVLLTLLSFRTDVYADYAVASLPLLFASAGAFVQLASSPHSPVMRWAVAAVLAAAVLPGTVSHLLDGTRFDYRPAYRHIVETAPELTVVTWPVAVQRHYAPQLRPFAIESGPAVLDSLLLAEDDLWVVASVRRHGIVMDDSGNTERWIAGRCQLQMRTERSRLDYRRYSVDLYRCQTDDPTP